MSDLSEARRKMALRDWHLRLTFEEADAVRAALDAADAVVAAVRDTAGHSGLPVSCPVCAAIRAYEATEVIR